MSEKLPKADYTGELKFGDLTLPCAVLEDGTRVLSERGMIAALGGKRGGAHWRRKKTAEPDGANLPIFASARNLEPFIDADLTMALTRPIQYKHKTGGGIANGVQAELIPQICDIWLKAREARALVPSQEHIAAKAELLMRGLAHVGIIALVDEATGYQADRDKDELRKILEAYISPELLPWTKRFPDAFYRELFRLMGWQYSPMHVKRPKYVGKLTNQLIYEKLPPGVLDELRRRNPPNEKGNRPHRFHQDLTEDIGNRHLENHIASVITLMKASSNKRIFERNFARAFPSGPQQGKLFEIEEDEES